MDPKGILKALALELRHELEGRFDAQGNWQPGDLERRLAAIGVRRDRASVPLDELPHLPAEDCEARRVVDAFLESRVEAGQSREEAVAEFVREAAYTWANRLLALRCMEARGLTDEIVLQKEAYGGKSLQHHRLARKQPERCSGKDEGLFAALFDEFERRAGELPLLFDPKAPEVALRPSVASLKRCIALLSGSEAVKGQEAANDDIFTASDALGWTYQFYQEEEKDRVDSSLRNKKGFKCQGADLIPKTTLYTEPYMVKFLVQNSLGAAWMGMNPDSKLCDDWEYYVRDADRAPVPRKPVQQLTFLDPACGSGHFLIEAFDLLFTMYQEEGRLHDPADISASILENNLYGADIDERAVQIAALALYMKAKERAPAFVPRRVNLVGTNIRLPAGKEHLEAFLCKHPEDRPLKPALLTIFEGLAHADELGSLLEIEEPVESELRYLRGQQGAQLAFDRPNQESGWDTWKQDVFERLRQHFGVEAETSDLSAAFFSGDASKGLSLVDLLARRYDIVATNPPYLGSKYMGIVVKGYLERHFGPGRRDLYAAFMLRCLRLATNAGRIAMVTQHSWMFGRSYVGLRSCPNEGTASAFRGLLTDATVETLAHLGPRAFTEIGGEIVNVALVVFARVPPPEHHRLLAFRLVGQSSPREKASLLRARVDRARRIVTRPRQADFSKIPESPLVYYLSESLLAQLMSDRKLRDVAEVRQGMATSNNARFVRCFWEATNKQRWVPYAKGGGYSKWSGLDWLCVDWEYDGSRLKISGATLRATECYFTPGLTYSPMSGGALGTRLLDAAAFDVKGASLFVRENGVGRQVLAAHLNTRLVSFLTRAISQSLELHVGYLALVPMPLSWAPEATVVSPWVFAAKDLLVETNPVERCFRPGALRWRGDEAPLVPLLLSAEGLLEGAVFRAYGISSEDVRAILEDTGSPASWFPMITGHDSMPDPGQETPALPKEVRAALDRHERRAMTPAELERLKRTVAGLYAAGPGGRAAEDDGEDAGPGIDAETDGDDSAVALGACIPIPAETFLEELSQKLEIHPISVYWLSRELREEGVVCLPELRRSMQDRFTVTVLKLLGHRWPRQMEAGEPLPDWADGDGIIPITGGTGEPVLLERVRQRIAEDFGADRVGAIAREFEEIMGEPLAQWLAGSFFTRHISQFKKRPIAWQIQSRPAGNGKRSKRGARRKAPVFSCLVYYHRLDADLLPTLRTQYVGPLRSRLQTELNGLEKLTSRTADQDARRFELEESLDELKAFDTQLERVIVGGFACVALDKLAAREPLDQWTSRDGSGTPPASPEAFLAQERKYDPDLNDGVRVNIAPLQHAGLLAADVLAARDLDKAISDRAEWRADERRWCREGKLPRPGWWPAL